MYTPLDSFALTTKGLAMRADSLQNRLSECNATTTKVAKGYYGTYGMAQSNTFLSGQDKSINVGRRVTIEGEGEGVHLERSAA